MATIRDSGNCCCHHIAVVDTVTLQQVLYSGTQMIPMPHSFQFLLPLDHNLHHIPACSKIMIPKMLISGEKVN